MALLRAAYIKEPLVIQSDSYYSNLIQLSSTELYFVMLCWFFEMK